MSAPGEDGERLAAEPIVGLGPGDPALIPVGALEVLRGWGAADVRGPDALRDAVARAGVRLDAGARVVAAVDAEAARLAEADPGRPTFPARETLAARGAADALANLWAVTVRLRADCPWDREQTAGSIVPHTLEEAYEVAEVALAEGPSAKLVDELGDLLFQTAFLALLCREQGQGDWQAVAEAITAKLVRRHPHVFGDAVAADAEAVRGRWEAIKRDDEGRVGIFHDVPESLPALLLARKVQRRAHAIGFDWPDWTEAWPKLDEELHELRRALEAAPTLEPEAPARVRGEAGDLLFAAVNVLRHANVDPELALRGTVERWRRRVERAEELATAEGRDFSSLDLATQDALYVQAKRELGTG